jgi:hypothetical protein
MAGSCTTPSHWQPVHHPLVLFPPKDRTFDDWFFLGPKNSTVNGKVVSWLSEAATSSAACYVLRKPELGHFLGMSSIILQALSLSASTLAQACFGPHRGVGGGLHASVCVCL